MSYLKSQLEAQYANQSTGHGQKGAQQGEEELVVYAAKSFEHYYTYDGIEVCGVRVVSEVEREIERLLLASATTASPRAKDTDTSEAGLVGEVVNGKSGKTKKKNKKKIKFSIVGYSLGGLIARHALGLLYKRGWFETDLEAVNFVTFATPHVGVRALGPVVTGAGAGSGRFQIIDSLAAALFNRIGAGMLAYTSRQLFLVDRVSFSTAHLRTSAQPKHDKNNNLQKNKPGPLLLSLSDPALPFYKALSLFQVRCLYGNVVNDARTCWYTSGVDVSDPYAPAAREGRLSGPYVEGYEGVVLDYYKTPQLDLAAAPSTTGADENGHPAKDIVWQVWGVVGMVAKVAVVGPLWFAVFCGQSAYQSTLAVIRKRQFMKGPVFEAFRDVVEVLMDATADLTGTADGEADNMGESDTDVDCDKAKSEEPSAYASGASSYIKHVHSGHDPELTLRSTYKQSRSQPHVLGSPDLEQALDLASSASASAFASGLASVSTGTTAAATPTPDTRTTTPTAATPSKAPTLRNLSPTQLQLISNLNTLTWLKFPTHIRHYHAHAAIVRRFEDPGFWEGEVVVRHWVEQVFVF